MSRPHELSAAEALAAFRARELSPVELITDVIAHAEAVEPVVNALCVRHFDEALEEARAAEQRYSGAGAAPRPLEGLPVAIKDEVPIAGRPWSQGSLLYRDAVATHTAPIAERIIGAGGIVHARATTPEFSCAGFTHSRLWGVTRNPWNAHVGVGGSSGGSAAALAAGTALLASGSDIGGSIRVPAAFNGVVGFKPPYGRVPVDPPFNLDRYSHDGPMARTVGDCLLFENVLAGPHPADAASLHPKLELPPELPDAAGLRVALSTHLADWPVDEEVRINTLAAGERLRAAGAVVYEVGVEIRRADVRRAMAIHWRTMFADWIAEHAARGAADMTAYALDFPRWCTEAAGDGTVRDGMQLEVEVQRTLAAIFDDYDALVCPTVATRGLVAGDDYVAHGLEVGGVELPHHLDAMMTAPFNLASRCPVLAVPSGFAANGVPTGIQIVGRPYDDITVFRLGLAYERAGSWPRQAPAPTTAEVVL